MAGGEERTLRDSAIGRGRRGARLQTEYRDQPNHVTTVERRRDAGQGLLCTPMEVDCHPTHFNFEAASRSSAQSTPSQPAPRRATPEHMTSELVSMTPQRSEGRWDGTTPCCCWTPGSCGRGRRLFLSSVVGPTEQEADTLACHRRRS